MNILILIYLTLTVLSPSLSSRWAQDFNDFPNSWPIKNLDNGKFRQIINDPTSRPGTIKTKVLKIIYPKGSCSSDCHPIDGGASFNVYPNDVLNGEIGTVEYDFYFPNKFDFVKGGKLPGLIGG